MKKTNNILKGASVLLIAAVMILSTVAVTADTSEQKEIKDYVEVDIKTTGSSNDPLITKGVFYDSFEGYPDFVVDDFPPWTTYDGDLGATYGMVDVDWPNAYYTGAFMIFNPSQTTPPIDGNHPALTGDKYASCWDTVVDFAPNDDWLFSPQLTMEEDGVLTFYGRSLTDQYGLEEIEYGISTTDTDPSSFTIVSGPVIDVPVTWTEYTYDLSAYTGQDIYVGIHVVSYDRFAFFLDDFEVTGVAIGDPDLDCDGSLTWAEVAPGATVTGDFTVSNIGDPLALLDWEIESHPDWGEWTFTPESGSVSGSATVDVEVVAPEDPETEFTGEVKIVNSDDASDFCIIDVALATPDVALATPVSVLSCANAMTYINTQTNNHAPVQMMDWLHYDDGVNAGGIGLTSGGTFQYGIRLTPTELAPYDGDNLTTVKFYHSGGQHSG
jgi:hypothetical protein